MKHLFFLAVLSMSSFSFAATDWKVVAETTSCDDKIQILGKDGEKYVLAVNGNEKTKLFNKEGAVFKEEAMSTTIFTSSAGEEVTYTFIQPSYVEANPPKIDVIYHGEKSRCKMQLNP